MLNHYCLIIKPLNKLFLKILSGWQWLREWEGDKIIGIRNFTDVKLLNEQI